MGFCNWYLLLGLDFEQKKINPAFRPAGINTVLRAPKFTLT